MSTRLYQHQLFVGILFVNLASLVWATNMVMGRWLRDAIDPVSLSVERHIGKDRWLLVAMAMTGAVSAFSGRRHDGAIGLEAL